MYQLTNGNMVLHIESNTLVMNTDATYLDWLEAGNTPTPAPVINVYGQIGKSDEYLGHTAPDDSWVQMQSERPEGDYVASETGEWIVPTPTTAELFKILTDKYESDSAYYRDRMSAALLNDGAGMEAKYGQIRASFAAVKAQYLADKAALLSGG